jgi:hypothetical protein
MDFHFHQQIILQHVVRRLFSKMAPGFPTTYQVLAKIAMRKCWTFSHLNELRSGKAGESLNSP